jgi:hypothetical protein
MIGRGQVQQEFECDRQSLEYTLFAPVTTASFILVRADTTDRNKIAHNDHSCTREDKIAKNIADMVIIPPIRGDIFLFL